MNKELEWNENELMSKEYALSVIESVKKFIRGRFYMPDRRAFNGEADFEAWNKEIDGLEDYIKRTQGRMDEQEMDNKRVLEDYIKRTQGRMDEQEMDNKRVLKVNKVAKMVILFLKKYELTIREALEVLEDAEKIIVKKHLDLKL